MNIKVKKLFVFLFVLTSLLSLSSIISNKAFAERTVITSSADRELLKGLIPLHYEPDDIYFRSFTIVVGSVLGMVKFDLSSVPQNTEITSARMYLYNFVDGGCNVSIERITSNWSENSVDGENPPSSQTASVTAAIGVPGFLSFDITNLVKDWYSNRYPNYGMYLDSHSIPGCTFGSREHPNVNARPALEVSYKYNVATAEVEEPHGVVSTLDIEPEITQIETKNIGARNARVTWKTDNEQSDSKVEYQARNNDFSRPMSIRKTTRSVDLVKDHEISLSGLEPATLYYYRVKSKDADGDETKSQVYSFKTTHEITNVRATEIKDKSVKIIWSTEPAVTNSTVEYQTDKNFFLPNPKRKSVSNTEMVGTHSITLTDLFPGATYYYRVRSKDSRGNSAISDVYRFLTKGVSKTVQNGRSNITTSSPTPTVVSTESSTGNASSGGRFVVPPNPNGQNPIRAKYKVLGASDENSNAGFLLVIVIIIGVIAFLVTRKKSKSKKIKIKLKRKIKRKRGR